MKTSNTALCVSIKLTEVECTIYTVRCFLMSKPLTKNFTLIQYGNDTRDRGLQRGTLQSISPFNKQDALDFG